MKANIILKGILLLLIFWTFACATMRFENTTSIENPKKEDLNKFINKMVTFTGKTVNMKLGAVLILENGQRIWMSKMYSWPEGYYDIKNNNEETKIVIVTGILKQKNDLPVFIQNEKDSLFRSGIPVPKRTDLKKASHRYLLKNYKWNEI